MTQLDMGKDLRDAALEKSKQGREERIEAVRKKLVEWRWKGMPGWDDGTLPHKLGVEICADDVWEAAESLGFVKPWVKGQADESRWLSHVTRRWDLVANTHRYVPSRLKQRHARPIPVFRWV